MKKTLFSSVVLASVIGFSSVAFSATLIKDKTVKTPVKVESKMSTHKNLEVKPTARHEVKSKKMAKSILKVQNNKKLVAKSK